MRRIIYPLFSWLIIWLVLEPPILPATVWATTYYVATTGNDSNNGLTAGAPFRNPQRCVNFVVAGDICTVADGTYTDLDGNGITVYINGAGSGTAGNPITFKSANIGGALIAISTNPGQSSYEGFHVTKNYIVVDGFEISGGTVGGSVSYAGVNVTDGVVGTVIKRNTIHHIGRAICSTSVFGFAGVFTLNAPSTVIDSNTIYSIGRLRVGENGCAASVRGDFNDHGIYIHGGSVTITNNVIYDSNRGWPVQFYGGGVDTISRIDMYHNTLDGQSPTGSPAGQVQLSSAITSGMIKNNIFSNALSSVFRIGRSFSTSGLTYDYNLTDNTDANMVFEALPANMTNGGHNQTRANPGFVSLGNHDYHLAVGSAAINAGTTIMSVTTDCAGTTRPQGAAYDIGAYEYVATAPVSLR